MDIDKKAAYDFAIAYAKTKLENVIANNSLVDEGCPKEATELEYFYYEFERGLSHLKSIGFPENLNDD